MLFRRLHGRYAQYLNIKRQRSGHLWQARYYSCPLSASHLLVALRYVEQNPCRAGLAKAPAEYRWSSAAAHAGEGADPSKVLDMEFWRESGGAATWSAIHAGSDPVERVKHLRTCTYGGRPFGEEEFVQKMEARFQRTWRRAEFERLAMGA